LAISLSLVLLLGIAVWLLYRYAGLKAWHVVVCVLFGFFLATTTAAPAIRHIVRSILAAIPGQH
jgi:F0F1-type ATP synthase assembly protein I